MPSGQTPTAQNRLPIHTDDDAVLNTLYVGGTSAPLAVQSSSVSDSKLTSAGTSLSTVASTNLSVETSRNLSLSTTLSVVTSTANSG